MTWSPSAGPRSLKDYPIRYQSSRRRSAYRPEYQRLYNSGWTNAGDAVYTAEWRAG